MRTRLTDNKQKSVVALVLARGGIDEFPEHGNLKYKALLPFLGQPLIAYVVDALADSAAENIFILQEQDACLESALRSHPKVNFINHDGPSAFVGRTQRDSRGHACHCPRRRVVHRRPTVDRQHLGATRREGCRLPRQRPDDDDTSGHASPRAVRRQRHRRCPSPGPQRRSKI